MVDRFWIRVEARSKWLAWSELPGCCCFALRVVTVGVLAAQTQQSCCQSLLVFWPEVLVLKTRQPGRPENEERCQKGKFW